jgi:hypothetical protein
MAALNSIKIACNNGVGQELEAHYSLSIELPKHGVERRALFFIVALSREA